MLNLIKKYSTFIKYAFASGTSFILDVGLFKLFSILLRNVIGNYAILVGNIGARIISSFYNYLMNKNTVFKTDKKGIDKKTFIKYYLLVVIQAMVSSVSIHIGCLLVPVDEIFVKIVVDVILFVINFFVQKKFIFNGE